MYHNLKGKKKISEVFDRGKSKFIYPVKMIFLKRNEIEGQSSISIGVGVSKKNLPKAVDRNKVKRRIREAVRKVLKDSESVSAIEYDVFFIYVSKELLAFKTIENVIKRLTKALK